MFVSDPCWSSSVYSDDESYFLYLTFGECITSEKSLNYFVIAVRDFDINEKKVSNKNIAEKKSRLDERKIQYKIGDIGPAGGIVFYTEINRAWECSNYLGNRNWYNAKELCSEYRGGGYSNWYLPSYDELNCIYENLRNPGKITGRTWFWSSSAANSNHAWGQRFSDGYQCDIGKSGTYSVRAVRAF